MKTKNNLSNYQDIFYNNAFLNNKSTIGYAGFTIVELIVVITILAILGTIGFVSFSSHLVGTRDTNRLEQLSVIYKGLDAYGAENSLPKPESSVEVKASGSLIGYQGYVGKNILSLIGFNKGGKDPRDEQYYSYYLTEDEKNFQLMAFLEDELNKQITLIPQTYSADYSKRFPTVIGKRLGILTEIGTNTPIQELTNIVSSGYLDIVLTTNSYKAYFTDQDSISGTGGVISMLESISKTGNLQPSCKAYIDKDKSLLGKDGIYYIYSGKGIIQTFCDMTRDSGGWTMFSSNGGHPAGTPTSGNNYYGKLSKTTMGNMVINNLEYNGIMMYRFGNNNYIIFDNLNSKLFNSELKDVAGETSANYNAQTNLGLTKHSGYINGYSFSKDSPITIFEVHRGGWNPASGTNWLLEAGARGPGAGVVNSLSYGNHGGTLKTEIGVQINPPAGGYGLFFR